MSRPDRDAPLRLELDPESFEGRLDQLAAWLAQVLVAQASLRRQAAAMARRAREPRTRDGLVELVEEARRHEAQVARLFGAIGREPPRGRALAAFVSLEARRLFAAAGSFARWWELRQLVSLGAAALGAFAVTEQLGLALGLTEVAEIALEVSAEKAARQEWLHEMVRHAVPPTVLYPSL